MSSRDGLSRLAEAYDELVDRFGADAKASQWRDRESQDRRLNVLVADLDLGDSSILDFGCGTGRLVDILLGQGLDSFSYTGIDFSAKAVDLARLNHPGHQFIHGSQEELHGLDSFDYVLVSGTFNNLIPDHWSWMTSTLTQLYAVAKKVLAFNNLSRYVDYMDPGLYYADPSEVLAFCKGTLSPMVRIEHDYLIREGTVPYEFTTRVVRTDIPAVTLMESPWVAS